MKAKLLFIFMLALPFLANGQFYNPYANQQAYEYGRQMAQQMMAQQEAQLRQNPTLMAGKMIEHIALYNDEKAYEFADYLADNRGWACDWYWLGVLNEAGIYDYDIDYAKQCYRKGARLNNGQMCQQRLNELEAGIELDESTVRNYCQQIVTMGTQAAQSTIDTYVAPAQCSSCYGSGTCKFCNNGYTSTGRCGVCRGTGRCVACNGEGYHK